jgi:putative membrane protein
MASESGAAERRAIMLLKLILRIAVSAVAIAVTVALLPGFHVVNHDVTTFLLLGLVIGLINAFIRPIVSFLTFPFTILTLGLLQLVINALMLVLASKIVPSLFTIDNFWWALLGGIIMGLVGMVLEWVLKQLFPEPHPQVEVHVYRRDTTLPPSPPPPVTPSQP